jgi:hypothetical protein
MASPLGSHGLANRGRRQGRSTTLEAKDGYAGIVALVRGERCLCAPASSPLCAGIVGVARWNGPSWTQGSLTLSAAIIDLVRPGDECAALAARSNQAMRMRLGRWHGRSGHLIKFRWTADIIDAAGRPKPSSQRTTSVPYARRVPWASDAMESRQPSKLVIPAMPPSHASDAGESCQRPNAGASAGQHR